MGAQASCLLDLPIGPPRITSSTSFELSASVIFLAAIQNSKFKISLPSRIFGTVHDCDQSQLTIQTSPSNIAEP